MNSTMSERIVEVTPEMAGRIEVIRQSQDSENGFQRELQHDRTRALVRAVKDGTFIPPIFVGELPDKRLVLIDGQHRLHAWKMHKFPLKAIVYPEKSVKDAAAQFIATNANGVRVSLGFRLKVDPGPDAKWMRELADKYEVAPNLIYNMVLGVTGYSRFYTGGRRVNKHAKELAERILEQWAADKRWNDRAYLYTSVACLKIVGTIVGESTNPTAMVSFLRSLDWSKRSRIGAVIGSSWVFQEKMYRVITRMMKSAGKDHLLSPKTPEELKNKANGAKASSARRLS